VHRDDRGQLRSVRVDDPAVVAARFAEARRMRERRESLRKRLYDAERMAARRADAKRQLLEGETDD
jgi:hypothetical protein